MSFLKRHLIEYLICMLLLSSSAIAAEHRFGLSAGTAKLYGDLKSSSDLGPSVRATYQYGLNRYLGIGLEGGVSRVEGDSEVTYSSSKYFGLHPYETTIIPMGVFARLEYPAARVRPFIEGGAGIAVWFPGKQNPDSRLATEDRVDSAVNAAGSFGGGMMFILNESWALELEGRGRYILSDDLDNVDGDIISGDDSWDDHTLEGGIRLVYRFGGEKPAPKRRVTQAPPVRKPRERSVTKPPAPKPVVSDRDNDGIPDTLDKAPDDPEDMDGFMDGDGVPDPDNDGDGIPDSSDPDPNTAQVVPLPEVKKADLPYSVHVSSFRRLSGANAEMTRLGELGIEAFSVLTAIPNKGNMYRVYAGRYRTESDAKNAAETMLKLDRATYAKPVKIDPAMEQVVPGMLEIFLHVSSFKTQTDAMEEAEKFSRTGYQTAVIPYDLGEKGIWHRVLIGPYGTREEAAGAAEVIKAWGLSDYAAIIETQAK